MNRERPFLTQLGKIWKWEEERKTVHVCECMWCACVCGHLCLSMHECGCTYMYICGARLCGVQLAWGTAALGYGELSCQCPSFPCASSTNRVCIEWGQMIPSLGCCVFLVPFPLFSVPHLPQKLEPRRHGHWRLTVRLSTL